MARPPKPTTTCAIFHDERVGADVIHAGLQHAIQGKAHVNLDMIYGTPTETDDDVRLTLNRVRVPSSTMSE